jgi:vancomycin resistance protein VanJ
VALSLLLGLFMLLHSKIPNRIGNVGSLVETFLPWFGLFVPVLLAGALCRRSASAVVALLLPVVVWLNLFGGLLHDKSQPGGDLIVASHNVGAGNPDPVGTARDLAASGADVLALEEMTPEAIGTYEQELAKTYAYHTVQGTVGLWSKLPLSDTQPVDIKTDAEPGAAHHGGHGPRSAGGVRGPPGVRTGEPPGGLLHGPPGQRRAGARRGHRRRAEQPGGAARRPERHHG